VETLGKAWFAIVQTQLDVKGKSESKPGIREKKERMSKALEVCLRASISNCPDSNRFPVQIALVRNSFLEYRRWHHDHTEFQRTRSAPCLGEHLVELNQEDVKRALHAQELHFSPIEALLGNRVQQWSIWHMSTCDELKGTPIPHMVFSFYGFPTKATLHNFSKEHGLEMTVKLNLKESNFKTTTMLETSWDYLPTKHLNPLNQGPLKIDLELFKYYVNPKRLLNLEDTRPGPLLVALARESNGKMKVYYFYTCNPEKNGECDGSCGNSKKEVKACKGRFYPYEFAEVDVLVPSGLCLCPDWRLCAYQDPRTSQDTRTQLQIMTLA